VAGALFIFDQITKYLVLYGLELGVGERLVVAPFVDLVLTFNRGISYGLFQQDGELGRWFLFAVKLVAAVLFLFWLLRAQTALVAVALGLLIGGAAGNALDRAIYGAVVDFVSLHAFGWRWYVFNLADTAIVAGVVGLLYDAVKGSVTKSPPSGST
jgi:signal peptidase II